MAREGINLREITLEELAQRVIDLEVDAETHDHLTSGAQLLSGAVKGILQSPNFISGSNGWQLNPNGSAEFQDITARGSITATTGAIGGWTISATEITCLVVSTNSAFKILSSLGKSASLN